MKATTKQKYLCKLIIDTVRWMQTTNDLSSPTHSCDIDEQLSNAVLFEDITEEESIKLNNILHDILEFIRKSINASGL